MKEKLKNNSVIHFIYRLIKVLTYRIIYSSSLYIFLYPHNLSDVIETDKKYTLLTCHNNGGGTYTYLKNKYNNQKDTLILKNIKTADKDYLYSIENNETHKVFYFKPSQIECLNQNIKEIRIIVVESYMSLEPLFNWMKNLGVYISYDIHDFHSVWKDGHLCNSKAYMSEEQIRNASMKYICHKITFDYWHRIWNDFFNYVSDIYAFSASSKDLFIHYFPDFKDKVKVTPHSLEYIKYSEIEKLPSELNIGIFGAIENVDKGCFPVRDFLKYAADKNLQININGSLRKDCCIYADNIHYHGKYSADAIRQILIEQKISVVLFPSVWPETFSYLVSELIAAGIPLACFNLGAQAEKVFAYKYGQIISSNSNEDIMKALKAAFEKGQRGQKG